MWTMEDLLRDFGTIESWKDKTAVCMVLAGHGQLDLLKEVRRLGADWDEHTPHSAVMAGSLGCVKYAIENDCPCSPNMIDQTLIENKADILEYFISSPDLDRKYRVNDEGWFVWHTVYYDQPECLKVLLKNSWRGSEYTCATAAIKGHVECLKLFIEAGHLDMFSESATACMMRTAAEEGQLESMQLLYQAGCELDVSICAAAEKGKNAACTQFADEMFITKWTETVFKSAAARRIQEWWLKKLYEPDGVMCNLAKRSFKKNNGPANDKK